MRENFQPNTTRANSDNVSALLKDTQEQINRQVINSSIQDNIIVPVGMVYEYSDKDKNFTYIKYICLSIESLRDSKMLQQLRTVLEARGEKNADVVTSEVHNQIEHASIQMKNYLRDYKDYSPSDFKVLDIKHVTVDEIREQCIANVEHLQALKIEKLNGRQ